MAYVLCVESNIVITINKIKKLQDNFLSNGNVSYKSTTAHIGFNNTRFPA